MRVLFCLLDGLGDEKYKELGNRTPLEHARTPYFDLLVRKGKAGILTPSGLGKEVPLASASNMLFSILGYDVREIKPTRGVVEALGAGIKIKNGDLCVRTNFATVDNKGKILSLRAGRIKNAKPLEKAINSMKFDVPFTFKSTVNYRGVLVFRGDYSDKITEVDLHKVGEKVKKAKALTKRAKKTAGVVNDFLEQSHEVLKNHSFNKKRKLPANFLLPRGFGSRIPEVQSFEKKYFRKACGLTGLDVNKGILKILGIKVIHVPEEIGRRELEIKRKPIKKALKKYDFVFVHFKNTDDPGHDGYVLEKVKQIELTDRFISSLNLQDTFIVITSDHATSCKKKSHIKGPIPTLISPVPNGKSRAYGEKYCKDFKIPSYKFMPYLRSLISK